MPTPAPLDRCDTCGYDADRWDDRDTIKTIALTAAFLRHWSAPLTAEQLVERVTPEVWSVAEYLDHVPSTLATMRLLVEQARAEPMRDLGAIPAEPPAGEWRAIDPVAAIDRAADEARSLARTLLDVDSDADSDADAGGWDQAVVLDGAAHSVRWASRHAVHDTWHHLDDIARLVRAHGAAMAPATGTLDQISRSGGGVPKTAVPTVAVDVGGVVGDVQAARVHHGRPWQALCLWSGEVIDALVAEGHPIAPGAAGENLTLRGIDWAAMHGGVEIRIGEMVARVSAPAEPCTKNNRWFSDGDSNRIDHDRHPGWSRWYASVLRPGHIATGDTVELG